MINPEPIRQAAALTGRGGRWSAHIEGGMPPTEPYKPPKRPRPVTGWPKTGTVGASTTLDADEEPVTVPGRPYADARRNSGQHPDRVAQTMHALHSMVPTEAQAAAIQAVHHAVSNAVHRDLLARAIGWFRR